MELLFIFEMLKYIIVLFALLKTHCHNMYFVICLNTINDTDQRT